MHEPWAIYMCNQSSYLSRSFAIGLWVWSHTINHSFNDYVVTKLKAAWKRLQKVKKDAYRHRQEFLRDRMKAHADEGHTDKADEVQKLIAKEAKRRTFQKLRVAFKGSNGAGLEKVIRPDEHGNDEEVTEIDELFAALLDRNKTHFGQAKETDLAKPPYSEGLPPFDPSQTEKEILQGDLSSFPDLDPILAECKR